MPRDVFLKDHTLRKAAEFDKKWERGQEGNEVIAVGTDVDPPVKFKLRESQGWQIPQGGEAKA